MDYQAFRKMWSGKRIAIVGFAVENQPTVDLFLTIGSIVTVYDRNAETVFPAEAIQAFRDRGATFVFGNDVPDGAFDLLVRSPGISPRHAAIAWAHAHGVAITSAPAIFFDLCPAPIIGVTGTKGKGTTSSLIAAMLKEDGEEVFFGGNIGTPMLSLLPSITALSVVVLELSSFQLMDLKTSPHIAVVLLTTSEHLDFHADEAEYVEAKSNIAAHQTAEDSVIVNADYPNALAIAQRSSGKKYEVSNRHPVERGCFVDGDAIVWRDENGDETIARTEDVRLSGRFNLENVCAAVGAAKTFGVSTEAIVRAIQSFTGLEHRLEFVREWNGVRYYDDSFATTPESAIAAIGAFEQPEVLILGGSSKGSDFSALAKVIVAHPSIRAIIGIGMEWPKIKEALNVAGGGSLSLIEGCQNMTEIIARAHEAAQPGDVVILSPACASFGMFKNYKERGALFKQAVSLLA